jgi:hypothetical protein
MPFNNGYIITSRATELSFFGNPEFSDANPTPIDPTGKSGAMYFLMSNQPYDQNYSHYNFTNAKNGNNYVPSATFPPPFANALRQDLARAVVNGRPQNNHLHSWPGSYVRQRRPDDGATRRGPLPIRRVFRIGGRIQLA